MNFIEWQKEYETGIAEIDNDHRKIFGILNKFYNLLLEGKANDSSQKLFDEMVLYAKSHFKKEEGFMAKVNYPLLYEHIAEHKAFEEKLKEVKNNFAKEGNEISQTELLTILTDWLLTHIMGTDMLYLPYLK